MVWAGGWNKLKDEPGKDVEHGSERGVDEGDDGPTTAEIFLPFRQGCSLMGAGDLILLPKDMLFRVEVEETRQGK